MTRRARGEGTVYQDGDAWIARIDLPVGPDGKRKQRKRRAQTKTKAIQKLKELQSEIELLDNPQGLNRTIDITIATFLESQPNSSRSPKTIEMEQWRAQKIAAGLGRIEIGKLSVRQCDRFLDRAALGEFGSRPMNLNTLRRVRSLFIKILHNEMRLGNLSRNVADLSILPDLADPKNEQNDDDEDGDSSTSIRRTLSYNEYRNLWNTSGHPLRVVVDLCGRNGLRPSEARALRWSRVDFGAMTIKIDRQMSSENKPVAPKTKRSRRTIQMDDDTAACLTYWLDFQTAKQQRAGADWQDNDLVVTTRYGTPINARNLRRSISAVTEKTKTGKVVPYELRHTAITFQVDAGNETWQVADWAGTSVRMIDEVYRHRLSTVAPLSPLKIDGLSTDQTKLQ